MYGFKEFSNQVSLELFVSASQTQEMCDFVVLGIGSHNQSDFISAQPDKPDKESETPSTNATLPGLKPRRQSPAAAEVYCSLLIPNSSSAFEPRTTPLPNGVLNGGR